MTERRYLGLNINLKPAGGHPAAWRHASVDVSRLYDFDYYRGLAQHAEAAGIDAFFIADHLSYPLGGESLPHNWEPIAFLSALAASTRQIGVIATISTTFSHPYNVARQIGELDRLSNGRAGWNIVTSGHVASAHNFGLADLPGHDDRYARADEFVEVVKRLLLSWEPEALVLDQAAGVGVDASRIRAINHEGRYFTVRGPLNLPRTKQGWPVFVQAGASDRGRDLAAKHADSIYSFSNGITDARAFYDDAKNRAVQHGRSPEHLHVFKAFGVLVERDRARAEDLYAELNELLPEGGDPLRSLSSTSGIDLSLLPDEAPIPPLPDPSTLNNYQTFYALTLEKITAEGLRTVGDLRRALPFAGNLQPLVGNPADIADVLEHWWNAGVIDGATFIAVSAQGGLENIFDLLIPELRRRGLRPDGYSGETLRDRYGFPYPSR